MNTNLGLIGKKLGNTQIFSEDGEVRRVTAIAAGPCVVLDKRTEDKHGYSALVLGYGEKTEKHVNKPARGFYTKAFSTKADVKPVQNILEFRLPADVVAQYEQGQTLSAAEIFADVKFVDIAARSKGRGFTGVIKRHNFHGVGTEGHGAHEVMRHGGSIGQNMTPGHTMRGMKMPGQHGNSRVTMMNIKVVEVLADENIVLVAGSVPGPRGGLVTLRKAAKKSKPAVEA